MQSNSQSTLRAGTRWYTPASPAGRVILSLTLTMVLLITSVGYGLAASPTFDLSEGQYDVVIRGNRANGYMSEITSSADFNDDQIPDLLLGAAGYDLNGEFSGAAFIVYGSHNLPATIDMAATAPAVSIYGASPGDVFGHSVSAGDVNGDGISDMIITADGYNAGDRTGAVYVFLGGSSLPSTIDLSSNPNSAAVTVLGATTGNRFGRSVASGDINGDGIDDLIVGAYTAWPGGRVEAGAVYAILGSTSFSQSTPTTLHADQDSAVILYGEGGAPSGGLSVAALRSRLDTPAYARDDVSAALAEEIGDRLGRSVAVGDINGDNLADIIAGAYGADVGPEIDAGKAYVVFGRDSYTTASPSVFDFGLEPDKADLTLSGVNAGDQAGFYVGSGNLNNDAYDDLLIGAYFGQGMNNAEGPETGEVYIVYGGPGGGSIDLSKVATVYGISAGDRLGRSVTSGDINNDGFDDAILGASRADPEGRVDAGTVYVIYGQASEFTGKLPLYQDLMADLVILGADSTGSNVNPDGTTCDDPGTANRDCSDEAGHSVSVGDLNGDGIEDLIVGALFSDNNSLEDAGASFVIYGRDSFIGNPVSVTLQPSFTYALPGEQVNYRAIGEDAAGANWDWTDACTFSTAAEAGGSWNGNIYTAEALGSWTVTATCGELSGTATLNVVESINRIYLPAVIK